MSRKKNAVVGEFFGGGEGEGVQQVINRQALFFLAADIENDLAGIHHNEAVAVGDGVLHIVGDHQGGETALLDEAIGKRQYLGGGFGVKGGGVLVQQQ